MRLLNTRAHAILDYLIGGLLVIISISEPTDASAIYHQKILCYSGLLLMLTACLTQFELGFLKILNLKQHYIIDLSIGAFLASSPWLFAFHETSHKSHLVFGLLLVFSSFLSDRVTSREVSLLLRRRKKTFKTIRSRKLTLPAMKLITDPINVLSARALKQTEILFKK